MATTTYTLTIIIIHIPVLLKNKTKSKLAKNTYTKGNKHSPFGCSLEVKLMIWSGKLKFGGAFINTLQTLPNATHGGHDGRNLFRKFLPLRSANDFRFFRSVWELKTNDTRNINTQREEKWNFRYFAFLF